MYYSFIYPYFTYCNHIWGSAPNTILNRLFILQKKAIRIICRAKPRDHTAPLFEKLRLLPLYDINRFMIGQFMFKMYHEQVPDLFIHYFVRNREYLSYATRHSNMFHIPRVRTEYGKKAIRYRGAIIWNNILQAGVSPDVSLVTFKYRLELSITTGNL